MPFDGKIMREAEADLKKRREERAAALDERRRRMYAQLPRAREIETQLRAGMAELMPAVMRGGDELEELKRQNLALQDELRAILVSNGFPHDSLDDTPACPKCSDSGSAGTQPCSCLLELCCERQLAELSRRLPLHSFDDFRLDYYSSAEDPEFGSSPRENISLVYDICLDFARKFGRGAKNLFFNGGTGLGKTMLAGCIARELTLNGHSVCYSPAAELTALMENIKFGSGEKSEDERELRRFHSCELFIIDDLGVEMATQFTISALYSIINSRLVSGGGTIITSNLSMDELRRRYSPQIVSRIEGGYMLLPFFGEDVRRIKKNEKYL